MIKQILTVAVALLITVGVKAQYMQLEGEVPSNWETTKNGKLSMSSAHYKLGKQSIRWDWNAHGEIIVNEPEGMLQALKVKNGGLMLWIYNDSPLNDIIQFQFGVNDKIEYHFDYKINFRGWRACWIRFDADMKGPKSSKNLSWMKIKAPAKVPNGRLFFDRMMFPEKAISRKLTPDAQLPYINPKLNKNHWGALYYWESNYKYDIELLSELTSDQKKGLAIIESNLEDTFKGRPFSAKADKRFKDRYRKFGLVWTESGIVGPPFVSKDEARKKSEDLTFEKIGIVFFRLAQDYYNRKDQESKEMFLNLIDYLLDQGFAYGSALGTNHHYGYQFRDFPPAIFLMRKVLKEEGKLEEVSKMLSYWTGIQEYRQKPGLGDLQGVMDSWNTKVIPRLLAIYCIEKPVEKYRAMVALKRWMDASLTIIPGTMGGSKADGCGFHHGGLYPAYCNGGFGGLGKYLKLTVNTPYALSAESRKNFGKALLTMRNYTHELDWGFGISGRHPLDGSMSSNLKEAFGYLAFSGDPYTGEEIWGEIAEAYLRIQKKRTYLKRLFKRKGFNAESVPEGYFTYNYGALGIHRRHNWMVSIKGYNKHVWGSEIYTKDNRYGRYQSYGTVQVMHKNTEESGYVEDGWDWNSYPGATNIHLPLSLLESPKKGTLMERSKEGFAGSSNLSGENGVFGVHLRERKRSRFTADFKALKSVFSFGDVLVCLGSDISNSNVMHPTKTTLFQSDISSDTLHQWVNEEPEWAQFPGHKDLANTESHTLIDPYGNGYWIPKGQSVILARDLQKSRHNKTKKPTKGKFATAHLNHGFAPKDASYEYAILPQTTKEKLSTFSKNMKDIDLAFYEVLQQDKSAHIVYHNESHTTSYVIFETVDNLDDDHLVSVSSPVLIMMQEYEREKFRLSLCDPDLHLPVGKYTTAESSNPFVVKVKLRGDWSFENEVGNCKITEKSNGYTHFEFTCVDGIPIELGLRRRK